MNAPVSPSFPTGLPEMRSEQEVRAARQKRIAPKPCPFCGDDPELGREVKPGWYTVGCVSDGCHICPQVSAQTLTEAWRLWNKRAPQLSVVASNSDDELIGGGGARI